MIKYCYECNKTYETISTSEWLFCKDCSKIRETALKDERVHRLKRWINDPLFTNVKDELQVELSGEVLSGN